MQGVLFGLFRDLAAAEKAHATLLASGFAPDTAILHHQDVPVAGSHEERPGLVARPADNKGVFSGLVRSFFNSGGEMDDTKHAVSVRQALHRGEYAVSVAADDATAMATAEKVFADCGAVLQLHPDA